MTRTIAGPLLALVAVYGLTLAASWAFVAPDQLLLALTIAPFLIWLSLTDLLRHEIPDAANLVIAAAGTADAVFRYGLALPLSIDMLMALSLMIGLWILGGVYFRRTGAEALGIGDAKLIGAGAICVGAGAVWQMIFLAATGGIVATVLALRKDEQQAGIAFGPFLAYAIFILLINPISTLNIQ